MCVVPGAFWPLASSRVVAAGSGVAGRNRSSACLCFPESGRVLAFFSHSSLELDSRPPPSRGSFLSELLQHRARRPWRDGFKRFGQVRAHAIRAICLLRESVRGVFTRLCLLLC